MERGGRMLDPDVSARELAAYASAGFDTFDMADHYGSAEIITAAIRGVRATGPCRKDRPARPAPSRNGARLPAP